jgi:hypothetical protein
MDPNTNIIRIQMPLEKGKSSAVKTRTTTSKNKNRIQAKLATHTIKRNMEVDGPRIETPAEQVLERRQSMVSDGPNTNVVADSYHTPDVPQTGYSEQVPFTTRLPLDSGAGLQSGLPDSLSGVQGPLSGITAPIKEESCIPTIGLDGKVKWGCLKNGTLPTYRTLRNKLAPPPPTYSVTDYSIASTPIRNLDIPIHPITTSDLLAKQRAERALHAPKQIVPLQKRTIRRTRASGMSKDKKEVLVQLSSTPVVPVSTQSVSVSDMKRYLIRRKLIDNSSSAPVDLIRELYQTAIASEEN